jgi:hypothetical protein
VLDETTLTVFECHATPAPPSRAPDAWPFSPRKLWEEGSRYPLRFMHYGTPVGTWRTAEAGVLRVTYEDFHAALRPRPAVERTA